MKAAAPVAPEWQTAIAWEESGVARTFAQIQAAVQRVRRSWRDAGLQPSQRIAVHGLPAYETWLCLLAAGYEACSIAPLPGRLTREQLGPYLEQLEFDFWVGPEAMPGLRPLHRPDLTAMGQESAELEALPLASETPYLLIYSSGSSGRPKAIQHSLRSLSHSAQASLEFYAAKPGQRYLLSLELSHIGGFQIALRCWLGGLRCCAGFATQDVGAAIVTFGPDFVSLVPTQLKRLLDDPSALVHLRAARAILLGGAGCPDDLRAEAAALDLPLSITYGSSEAASQVAAFPPGEYPQRADEVGYLLAHWHAALAAGHLTLRGPALCQGWWSEGHFYAAVGPGGAYVSEDLAQLEGRSLRILGRADGIFQVGAENLAPAEIIAVLAPLVARGDWIVIPLADAVYGQVPILIYRSAEPPPPREQIEAILRSKLPGIKRPRQIYWHRSADASKPSRAYYAQLVLDLGCLETTW